MRGFFYIEHTGVNEPAGVDGIGDINEGGGVILSLLSSYTPTAFDICVLEILPTTLSDTEPKGRKNSASTSPSSILLSSFSTGIFLAIIISLESLISSSTCAPGEDTFGSG